MKNNYIFKNKNNSVRKVTLQTSLIFGITVEDSWILIFISQSVVISQM